MRAFTQHLFRLIFLPILDMKRRGEGRCCGLFYIARKAHQHHRRLLAILWLRLIRRVSLVSVKTFWACCWKLRYEIKTAKTQREPQFVTFWLRSWRERKTEHIIIVYKSILSVLRQEFSYLVWLHVRPATEHKKIGQCQYFWIFRTDPL